MKSGDELEIEIDEFGAVRVTTHNVKGKRCLEYAELFQEILGALESKELTPEYNQIEVGVESQVHAENRVRHS
jgi:hypothetical protein